MVSDGYDMCIIVPVVCGFGVGINGEAKTEYLADVLVSRKIQLAMKESLSFPVRALSCADYFCLRACMHQP